MDTFGVVNTRLLNLRSAPSVSADIVGKLREGTIVEIVRQIDEDWVEIRTVGGEGYVALDFLTLQDTDPETPEDSGVERVEVTTSSLRVRSGPGSQYNIIGKVEQGTVLELLATQGDWMKVRFGGQEGYIASQYTRPTVEQPSIVGYLIERTELLEAQLVPEYQIPEEDLIGREGVAARVWNTYGGLLQELADLLVIPVSSMVAVIAAESSGKAFGEDGRLIVRFENHLFYRFWGKDNEAIFNRHFAFDRSAAANEWKGHQFRTHGDGEFRGFHGNQSREWDVLTFARALDDSAALKSISMGAPQIMGFNYKSLGYESVQEMFERFSLSAHAQVLSLFDFVKGTAATSRAIEALQTGDYLTFASIYNGPANAQTYRSIIQNYVSIYNKLMKTAVRTPITVLPRGPVEEVAGDGLQPVTEAAKEATADLYAVVKEDGLRIRSAPNTAAPILGNLKEDDVVAVIEGREDALIKMAQPPSVGQFVHIHTEDGITGYVAAWFIRAQDDDTELPPVDTSLEETDGTETPTDIDEAPTGKSLEPLVVVATVSNLRVRSEAGTDSEIIDKLKREEPVLVLEWREDAIAKMRLPASAGQFIKIRTSRGIEGYIAAWFVESQTPIIEPPSPPVSPPPPPPVVPPVSPPPVDDVIIEIPPPQSKTVAVSTTSGLRIRSAANTTSSIVGSLNRNEPVEILEDVAEAVDKMKQPSSAQQFIHIRTDSGKEGYVAAWLMAPSTLLTKTGIDAYIDGLPDRVLPDGYHALWNMQAHLGLPDPFDSLPVEIRTENELVNMQVNGFGPNTFASRNWRQWYSRIGGMHNGYDFIVKTGTPLLAVSDGVVIYHWIFMANKLERTIALWCFLPERFRDSQGRRMMSNVLVAYGHTSDNRIRNNHDVVSAGDVIGLSGTPAGSSTNDHLHYEVHLLTGDNTLPNARYPRKLLREYDREQPLDNNTPWNALLFYTPRLINYQLHQGDTIGYLGQLPDYPTRATLNSIGAGHLPDLNQFTLAYYRYGINPIWNRPRGGGAWPEGVITTDMLPERLQIFPQFEPYPADFLD